MSKINKINLVKENNNDTSKIFMRNNMSSNFDEIAIKKKRKNPYFKDEMIEKDYEKNPDSSNNLASKRFKYDASKTRIIFEKKPEDKVPPPFDGMSLLLNIRPIKLAKFGN